MARTKRTTTKDNSKMPRKAKRTAKAKKDVDEDELVPWADSEAKRLLRMDLIEGRVPNEWTGVQVKQMRPEYAPYSQARFTANLKTLRDTLERDYGRMVEDVEIYGHDMALLNEYKKEHPPRERDYPLFHDHQARVLLKTDVDNNKHKEFKPLKLRESRPEYQEFPPNVFRKHIYQEVDERLSREYRFAKKAVRANFRDTVHTKQYLEQLNEVGDVTREETTTTTLFPAAKYFPDAPPKRTPKKKVPEDVEARITSIIDNNEQEQIPEQQTQNDAVQQPTEDSFLEEYRVLRNQSLRASKNTTHRKPWRS
jgi:hypothetical protein